MSDTMNREEWLIDRKKGVGGSDIAAICGLSPYRSRLDVWKDKLGLLPDFEGNKFTKAGNYLEPVVAQMFSDETGFLISLPIDIIMTGSKPHYKYSIDRIVNISDSENAILEIKTTQKCLDEPLDEWLLQSTWYCGHMGYKQIFIAWLERGVDFKYKRIDFDIELFEMLCNEADNFWHEVENEIEPEPRYAFEKLPISGSSIEASDFMHAKIIRAAEIRDSIKELEEQLEAIKLEVKNAIGESETVTYKGMTLATFKLRKGQTRIDSKRLQEEMPDIYSKFSKTGESTRTFLIKI